jgi:hypothetical protein
MYSFTGDLPGIQFRPRHRACTVLDSDPSHSLRNRRQFSESAAVRPPVYQTRVLQDNGIDNIPTPDGYPSFHLRNSPRCCDSCISRFPYSPTQARYDISNGAQNYWSLLNLLLRTVDKLL